MVDLGKINSASLGEVSFSGNSKKTEEKKNDETKTIREDNEVCSKDASYAARSQFAGGKKFKDIPTKDVSYHEFCRQTNSTQPSFTLDGSKIRESGNDSPLPYDFVDILMYYTDPDTLEMCATKEQDENGDYIFKYNLNPADFDAKTYAIFSEFAYQNMDFFASTQKIETDGKAKEYKYGVFDVEERYEDFVDKMLAEGKYYNAMPYLEFNLEKFKCGSFYNQDGTLKSGADLNFELVPQIIFVADNSSMQDTDADYQFADAKEEPTEDEDTAGAARDLEYSEDYWDDTSPSNPCDDDDWSDCPTPDIFDDDYWDDDNPSPDSSDDGDWGNPDTDEQNK